MFSRAVVDKVSRPLSTSIAVAIVAHASLLLVGRWTPPTTQLRPPPTPVLSEPTEVEFVVLPSQQPTAPSEDPGTRLATAEPARQHHREHKIAPRSDAPLVPSITEEAVGETQAQGGEGGGSLRMRSPAGKGQQPDFYDSRQGSLLDDAVAAAAAPLEATLPGLAQIPTEARIGLDTPSTRITQWRDNKDGSKSSVGEPFTARIASDGRIDLRDHDNLKIHGLSGSFDLTDAALAAFGDVLYPYRKLKAMDQTREARAAMGVRARRQSLQSALMRFRRDLDRIWGNTQISAKQRRAILFALWDECAEAGPEEVLKTATAIRKIVIDFVRHKLPQGSPRAFTTSEIDTLNAQRSSKQPFRPYR